MEPTRLTYDTADFWIAKLCREIDRRRDESARISERMPLLAFAALACVSGVSSILHGQDAELVRIWGQLASAVSFGGVPVFVGWLIRDRMRRSDIAREDAAAYAELERRGYEHVHGTPPYILKHCSTL
jgi:hypothetical protein